MGWLKEAMELGIATEFVRQQKRANDLKEKELELLKQK